MIKINQTRALVMEMGVNIEEVITFILCGVLKIDIQTSTSLGFKSNPASFNQKVNIITDLKYNRYKTKDFQYFMEVRNKFAHVREIEDFTKCEPYCKDAFKFIKALSNQEDDEPYETYLYRCFLLFYERFHIIFLDIYLMINEKDVNQKMNFQTNFKNSDVYQEAKRILEESDKNKYAHQIFHLFEELMSFHSIDKHKLVDDSAMSFNELGKLGYFNP